MQPIDFDDTVLIDGETFYQHQHFVETPGWPDRCANCCNNFMDHNNGRCPVDENGDMELTPDRMD